MLHQNFTNPFNPVTTFSYQLPVPSEVLLVIYNVNGQLIETLVDENQQTRTYHIQWEAKGLSSGIYLYKLTAGDYINV